ncbi:hypothetical protein B0H34DRAFT_735440 [Crassisporium funariophilum]|nr:hypothetical protein B0H34DRAFT_735440 [Crassisporium funariophilum]
MPIFQSPGGQYVISGGNFVENTYNGINGLQYLQQAIAIGASHDSAERYPPPRCHPETRTSVINSILEWVADFERICNILWLYGPAGAGKSAIAQTIAELCEKSKQLGASYFFSRMVSGRNNARNLFSTIAYQLAQSIPEILDFIEETVRRDPTIVNKSMDVQLQKLIVEPFRRLPLAEGSKWSMTIIIDGLDECQDEDVQCKILELIADVSGSLPICFIIASRPETWILDVFDDDVFQAITNRCELHHSKSLDDDIRTYLQSEFTRIHHSRKHRRTMRTVPKPWPSPAVLDDLVSKATGQFIHSATVLRFVDDPYRRPSEQLQIILDISRDPSSSEVTPFVELDKLYIGILSNSHHKELMLRILGILRALILHASTRFSAQFAFMEKLDSTNDILRLVEQLLFLNPGDSYLALRDVNALVYIPDPKAPRSPLRRDLYFFHASFYDFLSDNKRCQDLFVRMPDIQADITISCIKMMRNPPSNAPVEDYFGWIYAIFHWEYHWSRSSPKEDLLEQLAQLDIVTSWMNMILHIDIPMTPDRYRDVLSSIHIPDYAAKPGGESTHLDVLMEMPPFMRSPAHLSWDVMQPIFLRFLGALDGSFRHYFERSADYKLLLVLLCMSGPKPMPLLFAERGLNVSRVGVEAILSPVSLFLHSNGYFGVKVDMLWQFLMDPLRSMKFVMDMDVHTDAAFRLLDSIDMLDSESCKPYFRDIYYSRCASVLSLAAKSQKLIDKLNIVHNHIADYPNSMSPKFPELRHAAVNYLKRCDNAPELLGEHWSRLGHKHHDTK